MRPFPTAACLVAALVLPSQPAPAAEPETRVLLEDARWRVTENRYPPGSESPLHTHRWPRTVHVVEGGVLELVGEDGAAVTVEIAAGQTLARAPETHRVRNPGPNTVRVLETEARPTASLPSYAFIGGRWFDGERFVERTLYSVDGQFTDQRPAVVDEIVELAGRWIVPPFGDAHAHHFDSPPLWPRVDAMYLAEGIFYGVSMNNFVSGKRQVAALAARPDTVDVAWADLGLTATLGHPIMVYETLARRQYDFDRTTVEYARDPKALGDGYVVLDDADDVVEQWPRILASRPDLLKIYLLYSEEHAERRDRTGTYGDRGLDPALVPQIVERAHASGLRVAAHVETVADFRLAVASGVDVIAHLPGYSPDPGVPFERYRITPEDARAAAAAGTVVVPTPLGSAAQRYGESDPEFLERVHALHRDSLTALAGAGVALAIGTDSYLTTASRDAFRLHELGLFSNLELLRMWSVTTPALAFPDRKIGRLEPGFEASFLALEADPLADFAAVRSIAYRFKQGRPVPAPDLGEGGSR